jgi:hypothetical protein
VDNELLKAVIAFLDNRFEAWRTRDLSIGAPCDCDTCTMIKVTRKLLGIGLNGKKESVTN